jgi:hypothetical protein
VVLVPDVRSGFSFAFSLFSDCQCIHSFVFCLFFIFFIHAYLSKKKKNSFVFLVLDEVSCDLEL